MKNQPAPNTRVLDQLLAEFRVTPEVHATIVSYLGLHGGRCEDALIDNDVISEAELLRFIATNYNTRFVSTEKLYKANIDQKLINVLPKKLCEQGCILPVLYDDARRALNIVTADPDNLAVLDQVKVAAGVREVVPLVARPAAIRAAIQRAYHNDASLFVQVMRGGDKMALQVDRFRGGGSITNSGGGTGSGWTSTGSRDVNPGVGGATPFIQHGNSLETAFQPMPQMAGMPGMPGMPGGMPPGMGGAMPPGMAGGMPGAGGAMAAQAMAAQAMAAQAMAAQAMAAQAMAAQAMSAQALGNEPRRGKVPVPRAPGKPQRREPLPAVDDLDDLDAEENDVDLDEDEVAHRKSDTGAAPRGKAPPPPQRAKAPPPEQAATLSPDYLETLNVLVSLLEASRSDLRGHSAQCARLVRRVCDRMGLPPAQTSAYVVATHLHDIGKAGTYHLTSLNVAEYDGHRAAAQKVANVPERFFQAVSLHSDTKSAVTAMYERFDGKGFPLGMAGKDIPLGARILAVVDSYCDLTANPRNPARRVLKPAEAIQFLGKSRGTVFDPTIVDLVKSEVSGDDLRAKLLHDRHSVLLVDPDPEDSTVLELRLLEAGFDVRTARTYQQALHELKTREFNIVVSDVDLDSEDAGLTLRTSAVSEPWGQKVTAWVVHTRKTDRQLAEIVFDLGVDDLVSKPTPPDVFVTKLRQLVERKQATRTAQPGTKGGVSGSLAEMALPDVIQILWHGRKTCTVRITSKTGSGELIFSDGQVFDAKFGSKRGEDAFYALLGVKEGDFKIETEVGKIERTINVSPEGLLLEGMRRLDEGLV
ncbi:MAG: DUF4388 domain-containing protein [Polyangiaceae bacterium]|jgi:response regulator RpfG family c-di-GMP phosphodiesterase|nr:DUF4388 domain-containing protein [Polyangiaceae bacterium]